MAYRKTKNREVLTFEKYNKGLIISKLMEEKKEEEIVKCPFEQSLDDSLIFEKCITVSSVITDCLDI